VEGPLSILFIGLVVVVGSWVLILYLFRNVGDEKSYLRKSDSPYSAASAMRKSVLIPVAQLATVTSIAAVITYKANTKLVRQTPTAPYETMRMKSRPFRCRYLVNCAIILMKQVMIHSAEIADKRPTMNTKYPCLAETLQRKLVSKLSGLRMNDGFSITRTRPANTSDPKNPTTKMTF